MLPPPRALQDIYAVDCITFHPTYGTFATTGSDGTFNFWDKDSRQRLKAFSKVSTRDVKPLCPRRWPPWSKAALTRPRGDRGALVLALVY